ncbi:unnamed protein product [Eretmochelys imbricata]
MAQMMQLFILVLLPVAILLPPGAQTGEIIGGQEAQPHSRPFMACLEIQRGNKHYSCGGFLVSENFVLTAVHCNGDKITVSLRAHNIKQVLDIKRQKIPVCGKIPHRKYNKTTLNNDIMLLQGPPHPIPPPPVTPHYCLYCLHAISPPPVTSHCCSWPRQDLGVDAVVMKDAKCLRKCNDTYQYYDASTMMWGGGSEDKQKLCKG